MRRGPMLLILPALAGGCDGGAGGSAADRDGKAVHVAGGGGGGVSVSVPGLDASLTLPGMDLSRHVDLDGIRVAPGSTVRTVDVGGGHGAGEGGVRLAFTSPRSPAALIDYYARAAERAGFAPVVRAGDGVSAARGDRRFALAVAADGAGSRGTISLGGA